MLREFQDRVFANLPRWIRICDGLVALRKAGELQAVWCDDGEIRIRAKQFLPIELITWDEAEAMICLHFSGRKEPGKECNDYSPIKKPA